MNTKVDRRLILLTAFLQNLVTVGYMLALGRLLPAFVEDYGWTRTEAGMIQSIYIAVFYCMGVVTGVLVQQFGQRPIASVGSLLVGIPICLSSFSKSFILLILTHGILAGVGTSFAFIGSSTVVSGHYKGRLKSLALTFVSCGTGVGAMVYSYFSGYTLQQYGLRGTFLINGAFALNGFAMPLIWSSRKQQNTDCIAESNVDDSTSNIQTDLTTIKSNMVRKILNAVAIVISDKPFVLYAFGNSLCQISVTIVLIYAVDLVVDRGGNQWTASLSLILWSVGNTAGRCLPGILKQISHVSVVSVSMLGTGLALAAETLIIVEHNLIVTLAGIIITGLCLGIQIANVSVATAKLIGDLHMPTGMGLILTIAGVGTVITGPLMGYIRETSGSYIASLLCSLALLVVSAVFLIASSCVRYKTSSV